MTELGEYGLSSARRDEAGKQIARRVAGKATGHSLGKLFK